MAKIERFKTKDKAISIVGTGHVLRKSLQAVKSEIQDFAPDAVALELDLGRFLALTQRTRPRPKGFVEVLLFELQKQAGKTTGVKPGAEMVAAAREARKHGIPVVLVDRDIRVTLKRALRNMTLSEKVKLLTGIIGGFFEVRDKARLNTLIDQKDELMVEFKRELPSVYKALVTERDAYMAKAISSLPYSKVLAVVGAGHIAGIRKRLEYRK
ncbi:MAG: TraB/GumN family protein [Candidatus Diapherotrites archaeon]|nr:TraB/GumN family protein [Candidatus Diapherotrites archaeon]